MTRTGLSEHARLITLASAHDATLPQSPALDAIYTAPIAAPSAPSAIDRPDRSGDAAHA
jgi:hypothetical protein